VYLLTAHQVGQAFTDTSESINIYPDEEEEIADVERNGRVFSMYKIILPKAL